MNKVVLALIIILVLLGGWWYFSAAPAQAPAPAASGLNDSTGGSAAGDTSLAGEDDGMMDAGVYTLADVASHNSAESCWSAIDGGVYDLTSWISQHPGGPDKILDNLCGKDGTTAFRNQHKDNQKQADILVTFKIGVLTQ